VNFALNKTENENWKLPVFSPYTEQQEEEMGLFSEELVTCFPTIPSLFLVLIYSRGMGELDSKPGCMSGTPASNSQAAWLESQSCLSSACNL
jgi:hypothetical protein